MFCGLPFSPDTLNLRNGFSVPLPRRGPWVLLMLSKGGRASVPPPSHYEAPTHLMTRSQLRLADGEPEAGEWTGLAEGVHPERGRVAICSGSSNTRAQAGTRYVYLRERAALRGHCALLCPQPSHPVTLPRGHRHRLLWVWRTLLGSLLGHQGLRHGPGSLVWAGTWEPAPWSLLMGMLLAHT